MADYTFVLEKRAITEEDVEPVKNLLVAFKVGALNLATLHWNVVGGNEWFTVHEKLGDWYEMLHAFTDKIVETFLSIGFKDKSVKDADCILEARDYECKEAMQIAYDILVGLLAGIKSLREGLDLPNEINSVLDEIENWLSVEAKYKIERFLE